MPRDSHVKKSVLVNSKISGKKVEVYVRKNKQTETVSVNASLNKENVIANDVVNASKAKVVLCVSCMQSVLIPCHDKCLVNLRLNVHSNGHRAIFTRTPTSLGTTKVVSKTRFSNDSTSSKSETATLVCFKPKIDVGSASKVKNKVSSKFKIKKENLHDNFVSPYMKHKIQTSQMWKKWFESKHHVIWSPVNTTSDAFTSHSNVKTSG